MLMHAFRRWRRHILTRIPRTLDQALEHQRIDMLVLITPLVRLERRKQAINPEHESIIDYSLIFECLDLVTPAVALVVDLGLFGADEGFLVDVGVHFDV